jgi:hypothetical protein
MFPQAYDIARLTAIRVYGSYSCTYLGDGEFAVGDFTTLTDDEGAEIPYAEFPYEATVTLGGCNVIIVSKFTAYDDVLAGRVAQKGAIKGKYEQSIGGQINLNALYEWCKLNA